jgi:glycosyltransferase involved in cell wall biosynthesis
VSDAVRRSFVNWYSFPPERTIAIRNGVSLTDFTPSPSAYSGIREKLGLKADEFVLLCAARLSHEKGFDVLLQAMAEILRSGIPANLIIAGDGPLREELREQAKSLKLDGHVFFVGFQRDVRPYLHTASAFILTSRKEGLPLSILEAMACGLPCIVTDVGGNAEAVLDGHNGRVIVPESPEAVVSAVRDLADHPEERVQMGFRARARASALFNVREQLAAIRDVIVS